MAKAQEFDLPAPRENPHLFGHEAAEEKFLQDYAGGRLHHAYLITGPKGIGKATLAYRMARYVLSQGALSVAEEAGPSLFGDLMPAAPAEKPTGMQMNAEDTLFRRIAAGSHTDMLSLAPAYDTKKHVEKSQISVEDARKVPSFLNLTPAEGSWRVVVVDAVDQLNTNAANALLKILEEPPANALLLLVCHEPGGILPTIRSRCRQFALVPPNRAAFDQVLQTITPSLDLSDYPALYALSYGSPGLAITLAKYHGLALYEDWLKALQPNAEGSVREQFIAQAAGIKSPEAWAMLLHGWNSLMHRVTLYPHQDSMPIVAREEEGLRAIAEATPFALRQRWLASARSLLNVTDTFHLDKKLTIRLLLDPDRLTRQFPAAA